MTKVTEKLQLLLQSTDLHDDNEAIIQEAISVIETDALAISKLAVDWVTEKQRADRLDETLRTTLATIRDILNILEAKQ